MRKSLRKRRTKIRPTKTKTARKSSSLKRRLKKAPSKVIARRRVGISDARLERALRVYSRTKDATAAARSIRVSVERFKRAAIRRVAARKKRRSLAIVRRLPRKMPLFSDGKLLSITVKSKSASLTGRYMSAVGQFLQTNDPKFLEEFKGRSVKDTKGTFHQFEAEPNQLYRLSSAGAEPFEDIYRIVI
jgi:hypothetical protein